MRVKTRHNTLEDVCFDKITSRINVLCSDLVDCDASIISRDTVGALYDGISTSELDEISANICATRTHDHPSYGLLGGRILASNIAKNTHDEYWRVVKILMEDGQLSDEFLSVFMGSADKIQAMFDWSRDYLFDYFAM